MPALQVPEKGPENELERELLPRLSAADEEELAQAIAADITAALQDRQDIEREWAQDERQYLGDLPEKVVPWPGCSNMNVPLTMLGVETLKPRLVESVLGDDQPIRAVPTEITDEDLQDRTETLLNWQALNPHETYIAPVVEESAHRFLMPGTVTAKVFWRTERRPIKVVRRFAPDTSFDEIFRAMFGADIPGEITRGDDAWCGTFRDKRAVRF